MGNQFTWLLVMVTQASELDGMMSSLKGWSSAEHT